MEQQKIEAVKTILMKYCNPKQEYDHVSPAEVCKEIVDAVEAVK